MTRTGTTPRRRGLLAATLASAAVVVLGITGCADSAAADRSRAESCTVPGSPRALEVTLRIPEGWDAGSGGGGDLVSCSWEHGGTRVYVEEIDPDPEDSLERSYRTLKSEEGHLTDDGTEGVELERSVEVFRATPGDRLSYFLYSDGSPGEIIRARAAGIEFGVARDARDRRGEAGPVSADLMRLFATIADTVRVRSR